MLSGRCESSIWSSAQIVHVQWIVWVLSSGMGPNVNLCRLCPGLFRDFQGSPLANNSIRFQCPILVLEDPFRNGLMDFCLSSSLASSLKSSSYMFIFYQASTILSFYSPKVELNFSCLSPYSVPLLPLTFSTLDNAVPVSQSIYNYSISTYGDLYFLP